MMEGGGIECDGVGSVADEDLLLDLCEHRPIMPPDIPREAEDLTTKGSYRAPASKRMWAWSIKRVANVWQNCIEINGKAGPVVSTVLALPMPPWKRCSKFLEH